MESKKPAVSDEAKAAAAKRAAAAKKAAEAKKAGGTTKSAPEKKAAPKKVAPKKDAPPREAEDADEDEATEEEPEEEVEDKPVKKKKLEKAVTDEERKSVKGLRTAAIILWVLAFAAEVGAFFALRYAVRNNALNSWTNPEMLLLIGMIVLDAVLCIIAAQLWKKSNRISPCLADSKLVRTLWHQMGVIMALVCLVPIGIILLLKTKNMDKRMRTILLVAFALLFSAVTASSVDYKQPSEEEVQQLQEEAVAANAGGEVYWTRYGKSYHFDPDCQHIRGKVPADQGGTLFNGTLDDAFAANRWDPCDVCAGGADVAADTGAAEDAAEELAPAA